MINRLSKYTAPLVLLFALLFLTGAAAAVDAWAGKEIADLCCQNETESPEPRADTECFESNCRCLSCSEPVLFNLTLKSPLIGEIYLYGLWAGHIPTVPGRTIDYPPEHS